MKRAEPLISVVNRQRKIAIDMSALQEFAGRALALCLREAGGRSLRSLGKITLVLVSDRRMAELHQRFMQISGPTDVLTFQHGEIIISVETARRQAREFGTSTDREVRLYIVHGLLHLSGLDDRQPAAAQRMRTVQTRILRAAG